MESPLEKSDILSAIKNGELMPLLDIILNLPIAHVNRTEFLAKTFNLSESDIINNLVDIPFEQREKAAKKQINSTVLQTSAIAFASGIPGGIAMVGTVPGDILQNMVYSVRLAQQLAFIYDIDIEKDDKIDAQSMVLFLGTMFGVNGAASLLRVTSTNTGKYLSQKVLSAGLSKTIWYPVFKKIVRIVSGKTLTIKALSKSTTKILPIIGGITSGGLTFVAMKKAANLLNIELQKGHVQKYSVSDYEKDIVILEGEFQKSTEH